MAYKKNDGPVKVIALPDFKTFKKDHHDDYELIGAIRDLLEWADIVIAHNGDRFDLKKINTRMLMHGYTPPSGYDTVDTLKIVKSVFGFPINKLDYVCRELGIGRKLPHTGLDLWEECEENPKNLKAWKLMRAYNAHDVYLLEQLHKKIRPWAKTHPKINVFKRKAEPCPRCNSEKTWRAKIRIHLKNKIARRYYDFKGDYIKKDEE
jgi:DNA polymerase elongation subunit (family B)